jgi:ubiquitin-protein ligase
MPLTALAIRRITRDINTVMSEPGMGYYYVPDDTNMAHGWAVIIGPVDTPYEGGAFCFEVRFPDNYPFEPPIFTYLTNDGFTRFNPNLYKNGKVCLSLLNTWQGEQWSGIQSLSSILQSIQTAVLNEEPLRNEPGYSSMRTHMDFEPYKRMVFQAVLQTAILQTLAEPPDYLVPVYDGVRAAVVTAAPRLIAKARALAAAWDGKVETMGFFGMTVRYRFGECARLLESVVVSAAGGGGGGAGVGAAATPATECEF